MWTCEDVTPDDQTLTDLLVDQARVSEHVTALILLLIQIGIITGPEYEAVLQRVVSARFVAVEIQESATKDANSRR